MLNKELSNKEINKSKTENTKADEKSVSLARTPFPKGVGSKLELYRLLVDELIKDVPDKSKVRDYCKFLKIPYSLNSATQMGTVFNRLQSLNRQVINE